MPTCSGIFYITVYSETGRGTTFKIYLPLLVEEIKEAHWTREAEPLPGGTETILLAEDEVTVRELHKIIKAWRHGMSF